MKLPILQFYYLVFNRWAISGSLWFNPTFLRRCLMQVFFDKLVSGCSRASQVTTHLLSFYVNIRIKTGPANLWPLLAASLVGWQVPSTMIAPKNCLIAEEIWSNIKPYWSVILLDYFLHHHDRYSVSWNELKRFHNAPTIKFCQQIPLEPHMLQLLDQMYITSPNAKKGLAQ